jgi:hypothetical protein
VPILFIGVILTSSLLGTLVARFYSEPMNRLLRQRWGDGSSRLGSVLEDSVPVCTAPSTKEVTDCQ